VNTEIDELMSRLRAFNAARDWGQFHSPKNLACALSAECGELLEHFQWLSEEQSRSLDAEQRRAVALEAADVLIYLLELCDGLGIDPLAAAREKIEINARKYPVEKSRGSSRKHSEHL
jgi:dCTP diphosphatase